MFFEDSLKSLASWGWQDFYIIFEITVQICFATAFDPFAEACVEADRLA